MLLSILYWILLCWSLLYWVQKLFCTEYRKSTLLNTETCQRIPDQSSPAHGDRTGYSEVYTTRCTLSMLYTKLYTLSNSMLYTGLCTLSILYTGLSTLYVVHFILYTVCCMLYILRCILCTAGISVNGSSCTHTENLFTWNRPTHWEFNWPPPCYSVHFPTLSPYSMPTPFLSRLPFPPLLAYQPACLPAFLPPDSTSISCRTFPQANHKTEGGGVPIELHCTICWS